MRIGFFGDSYIEGLSSQKWTWILCEKFGADPNNCVNFAKGGSSLYYSYKNIKSYGNDFDMLIVTVPTDFRYPSKVFFESINDHVHISNIDTIEHLKTICDEQDNNKLEMIKQWMLMQPTDYSSDMHELMLQDLERTKNLTLLPSFDTSFCRERKYSIPAHFNMAYLSRIDKLSHGISAEMLSRYQENPNVFNHFSEEMHPIVANVIYKWITNKVWNPPPYIETTNPKEFYWTKRI